MEEKKLSEMTKDEIFSMSSEDFNKALSKEKMSTIDEAESSEASSEANESNSMNELLDTNESNETESSGEETKQIDNKTNFWQNFNNVNQDETNQLDSNESSDESTPDIEEQVEDSVEGQNKSQQQVHKVKAYGQTMNFTTEELIKLAPKALHFTKKLQKLAPYRRTISAMEENDITEDDINQFIEMKKGNKTAISNFLNKANIDLYELPSLDENSTSMYTPNKYGREQNALSNISEELSYHPRVSELQRYVESLDKESKDRLAKNPDVLEVLMSNIENGHFDIIQPEAAKRAFLDSNKKPAIEYYAEVANEYYKYLEEKDNSKKQAQFTKDVNQARSKVKLTGNTGIKTQQKKPKEIRSAYDITDEELRAFEKQMGFL